MTSTKSYFMKLVWLLVMAALGASMIYCLQAGLRLLTSWSPTLPVAELAPCLRR
jgi:hypothetical protein